MRSVWKGRVSFGMAVIPSRLYSATDDKKIGLHQYHGECGSRIQMPKWCPVCQRKLEASELRRGYELSKDEHIILEASDFESLPLRSLKWKEVYSAYAE